MRSRGGDERESAGCSQCNENRLKPPFPRLIPKLWRIQGYCHWRLAGILVYTTATAGFQGLGQVGERNGAAVSVLDKSWIFMGKMYL